MCSELLSIGPLTVHGYGLMIGLGVVFALSLAWHRADERGIPQNDVTKIAALLVIFGFLGAKVLFILVEFRHFLSDPLSTLGSEGFVVYGGILAGLAALWIYCRKTRTSLLRWLDLMLPPVAVGQGFGRLGCFMAGCCYGKPTTSPLGVVFPSSGFAPAGIPLWPVQLFSAGGDFLLAGLMLLLDRKKGYDGRLTVCYLLSYGVGRFLIEFLRDDARGSVGLLSTSQFISLFVVAGAAALWATLNFRKEKKA